MNRAIKERQETEIETTENVEMRRPSLFARRPLSVLGKIALWSSAVRAFSGVGGVVAVTLITGSLSWDLLSIMVLSLVCAVLLATRVRWAPLVSTLLTAYLLYITFTQPFIVESLISPKGPDGGFGKFIGMVLNVACAILAFGSSVGATVEIYRQSSRKAPRWLPSGLTLVAGMIIGAVFIGAISQPPVATAGTAYTNGVPTVHLQAGSFSQSSVTISKGASLLLVDDASVVHDLFNGSWQNSTPEFTREAGAPLVNNVQLNKSSIKIGPFVTAGTYHIFCTIHRGMELTIIVQ